MTMLFGAAQVFRAGAALCVVLSTVHSGSGPSSANDGDLNFGQCNSHHIVTRASALSMRGIGVPGWGDLLSSGMWNDNQPKFSKDEVNRTLIREYQEENQSWLKSLPVDYFEEVQPVLEKLAASGVLLMKKELQKALRTLLTYRRDAKSVQVVTELAERGLLQQLVSTSHDSWKCRSLLEEVIFDTEYDDVTHTADMVEKLFSHGVFHDMLSSTLRYLIRSATALSVEMADKLWSHGLGQKLVLHAGATEVVQVIRGATAEGLQMVDTLTRSAHDWWPKGTSLDANPLGTSLDAKPININIIKAKGVAWLASVVENASVESIQRVTRLTESGLLNVHSIDHWDYSLKETIQIQRFINDKTADTEAIARAAIRNASGAEEIVTIFENAKAWELLDFVAEGSWISSSLSAGSSSGFYWDDFTVKAKAEKMYGEEGAKKIAEQFVLSASQRERLLGAIHQNSKFLQLFGPNLKQWADEYVELPYEHSMLERIDAYLQGQLAGFSVNDVDADMGSNYQFTERCLWSDNGCRSERRLVGNALQSSQEVRAGVSHLKPLDIAATLELNRSGSQNIARSLPYTFAVSIIKSYMALRLSMEHLNLVDDEVFNLDEMLENVNNNMQQNDPAGAFLQDVQRSVAMYLVPRSLWDRDMVESVAQGRGSLGVVLPFIVFSYSKTSRHNVGGVLTNFNLDDNHTVTRSTDKNMKFFEANFGRDASEHMKERLFESPFIREWSTFFEGEEHLNHVVVENVVKSMQSGGRELAQEPEADEFYRNLRRADVAYPGDPKEIEIVMSSKQIASEKLGYELEHQEVGNCVYFNSTQALKFFGLLHLKHAFGELKSTGKIAEGVDIQNVISSYSELLHGKQDATNVWSKSEQNPQNDSIAKL